ncbi:porin [Bordetella petrii]|uniref:Outer membrane porin protein n=1 Tax=Bordetella petrii (strain ATCC BAA-461 / DSM 12804 / CCUG 43448 / CIP 107267 / Se-1111R) TaxID=340100 RepID=A9I0V5_BORPD|nr:porin [Bordetella petrii]CAP40796.1 outer membrane porin protein precursor [Bordetella petrii]
MKKTLLAVALAAGFAGVAQAETSVTLYGLIDAGIGYNQVKGSNGDKASRIGAVDGVNSGSRFGLRGVEDLGDGLKALFTLEGGFSPNNGTSSQGGRLFGRQATVGLQSDSWGQLDFGRQTNLASKYFAGIDPSGISYDQATMGTSFSSANTVRLDNMVLYQTPSFSGFKFGVGYSFNADDNATTGGGFRTNNNNRVVTVGARYQNGPLDVALSYDNLRADSSRTKGQYDTDNVQSYIIGAAYDFEVVKVSAAFGQTFDGWFVGTNIDGLSDVDGTGLGSWKLADGSRVNSYLLGISAPIGGASNIWASWQRADINNSRLAGDDATSNTFSLGYTYDLSKRTNLYAMGSYGDNWAFQEDQRSTAVAVGLRHRF